jgi:hypothetical protein
LTYNARDIEFEVMIFVNGNSNKLQKTRFLEGNFFGNFFEFSATEIT